MTACPIASKIPGHGCIDDITTECSFGSQATCDIDVLGLFFQILVLSMGVCTTRHWQTSGRLLQELNVCTVTDWQYLRHVLGSSLLSPQSLCPSHTHASCIHNPVPHLYILSEQVALGQPTSSSPFRQFLSPSQRMS